MGTVVISMGRFAVVRLVTMSVNVSPLPLGAYGNSMTRGCPPSAEKIWIREVVTPLRGSVKGRPVVWRAVSTSDTVA